MKEESVRSLASVNQFAGALAAAVGLTMLYWWPMWLGDGVIGGDIMDYFFPQKVYLAKWLAEGDLPLWNNLVNLGYPFVADSQIALWYPTTIPLYSMMSVEGAFQTNILIHYVIAFLGTWAYARTIGLRQTGSLACAMAFTYGWFPPRLSVEWAVTTGCYFPVVLLGIERYLTTSRGRWLAWIAFAYGLQLLAGHFSLAFITHLTASIYTFVRLFWVRRRSDSVKGWRPFALVLVMQAAGFLIAGAQLAPTWELRQQSSRGGLPIPEVDHGRIPWNHLHQLVMPWIAYHNDMSEYPPPYTNGPAASLFVGVLPFLAAVWVAVRPRRRKRVLSFWLVAIPIAVVFAIGLVTPIYKYLPGFGYFKIPGRYSLIAAIGLAAMAGAGADRALSLMRQRRVSPKLVRACVAIACVITFIDLYNYGRRVAFTSFVPMTIDVLLKDSHFAKVAAEAPEPLRMVLPGNNALTATGISAVPGFLGLAPAAYVDHASRIPVSIDPNRPPADGLKLLQQYGVTHVAFEFPFDAEAWGLRPDGQIYDSFLSRVMDRYDPNYGPDGGVRPFYMAAVPDTRGRSCVLDDAGADVPSATTHIVEYRPDRVVLDVETPVAANAVLTDLPYPGWHVAIDGQQAEAQVFDGLFRSVNVTAGSHQIVWEYRPVSIAVGWLITAVGCAVALGGLLLRRRTIAIVTKQVPAAKRKRKQ